MNFDKMLKKSYWNNKGKYQQSNDLLWDKLVPAKGKAKTMHGEALRCMSRVYYDLYNNGGGNFDIMKRMFNFLEHVSDDITENSSWNIKMFDKFSKWVILLKENSNIPSLKIVEQMIDCVIEHCYFVEFGERLDQPVEV